MGNAITKMKHLFADLVTDVLEDVGSLEGSRQGMNVKINCFDALTQTT